MRFTTVLGVLLNLVYTVSKKASPTFSTVTWKSIISYW